MSIIDIVSAISADVVAKIAAAGLPPLVDQQIVIGRDKDEETSAPPRVVFIPVSFKFEARSNPVNYVAQQKTNPLASGAGVRSYTMTAYGSGYAPSPPITISAPDVAGGIQATATATVGSNGAISRIVPNVPGTGYLSPPTVTIGGTGTGAAATANLRPGTPALGVAQQLAIGTEVHKFEVRVWGVNSANGVIVPDPILDYAATQQLYGQVIASAHALFPGVHAESNGQWLDAQPDAMSRDVLGRGVKFFMEIATPTLREPMVPTAGASIQYAPPQTQGVITNFLVPSDGGTPEQG